MPLNPGTRLGPYDVIAPIGSGGMGDVYQAVDTALGRQVAIKVLPEAFAQDADRLARFEREARTLASLNHPNIAIVHGLERSSAVHALVMELVPGPTLAERIAHGPVAVDEALRIAAQIADALDAAHEQGIVHRDLKPANIKVREDGTVKVLDFGLAKAVEPAGAASGLTYSPTITSPAMTQAGILLGTAAYMSPEQARGRVVDKRADIWAFGAVLYEMVSGHQAFAADDVSDVLASVLAREPDWTRLPGELPPTIGLAIKRCLQKDPKQRFRDIGDVSLALKGAFDSGVAPTATARPFWHTALLVVASASAALAVAGFVAWRWWPSAEPRRVTRFDVFLPGAAEIATLPQRPVIAISPDGRQLVYETQDTLMLRSMSDLEARPISGVTEQLASPFFSPDGQWLAYATYGGLKKVSVTGGTPVTLTPMTVQFGASWSSDNSILFVSRDGIMRVSANGGKPELLIRAAEGESLYGPQLLPDGRTVLFSLTDGRGPDRWMRAKVVAQSLSSGQRTVVVSEGHHARYLPTGHVVYVFRDALYGVAFDPARLTSNGSPVPLVQGIHVPIGVIAAGANVVISDQGTLAYVAGGTVLHRLVWQDRTGKPSEPITTIPAGRYDDPRLSRDGSRLLVTRDGDIWIYDIASGRASRATRDGVSVMGVWSPDGTQVAYSSASSGGVDAWAVPSDGSGPPRQLTKLGGQVHVDAWSPDGKTLTFHRHAPDGAWGIFTLSMQGSDHQPQRFLPDTTNGESVDFSRDGRYVVYSGVESTQREIYIRPYPGPGGQVTVSVGGGREPMWNENGDVFYRSVNGDRMFAVSVSTAPTLKIGPPVELFREPYYIAPTGSPRPQYDVTADGQRFLMLAPVRSADSAAGRTHIVVVQNWFEELKRLVPIN